MVKAKTFREDLYYRLNVVRIKMPPLRERGDDIPQIVDFCLQNLVKQKKARVSKVSPEAMAILTRHTWPGNVRELENVIYRSAVIAQGDAILVKDLPAELGGTVAVAPVQSQAVAAPAVVEPVVPMVEPEPELTLESALDFVHAALSDGDESMLVRVQRELAQRTLASLEGDETAAAKKLGLTKPGLKKLLAD
jgi:two-component system nitrogen regulation response regulator GlnG